MNIDVVEPVSRLHLQNAKVTALHYTGLMLFAAFATAELSIIKVNNTTEPVRSAARSLRSFRSANDIKGTFSDNEQLQLYTVEKTFKVVAPLTRLEAIPVFGGNNRKMLVAGTTDMLYIYEWAGPHFNLVATLDESRGWAHIHYFPGPRLLYVSVKKRLLVYKIVQKSRNIFAFDVVKEMSFRDRIRAIFRQKNGRACLVLNNTFVSIDDDFGVNLTSFDETLYSSTSYFGLSGSGPDIKVVELKDAAVLTYNTGAGVIEQVEDDLALVPSAIKFPVIPSKVLFISPTYLLVLYSKRFEIIEIGSGDKIQEINHSLGANVCVSAVESLLVVGSSNRIFHFNVAPIQKQMDQYLTLRSRMSRDMKKNARLLGIEKAISLVESLEQDDDFFIQSGNRSPSLKQKLLTLRDLQRERAIALFEGFAKYHEALVELGSEWLLSFDDILRLFPPYLNGKLDQNLSLKASHRSSAICDVGADEVELTSLESTDSDAVGKKSERLKRFEKAVSNLIIYLTEQRRLYNQFLSSSDSVPTIPWKSVEITPFDIHPDLESMQLTAFLETMAMAIDTSLFLCYFYNKPMLLGPLLRLPSNRCNAKVVRDCLIRRLQKSQEHSMNELLDFYFGRGLHKEALDMLQHQNMSKGDMLALSYLKRLQNNHLNVIFEYAKWVLSKDPLERAESLFMSETYECESYDTKRVLEFITDDLKNGALEVRYLEWLIHESDLPVGREQLGSDFSTKLCLAYLQRLKSGDDCYGKLSNLLQNNTAYDPWTVLKHVPVDEDRLLRLTVFIYKRLGEHQKSVDVLFNQLNDLPAAMFYCATLYNDSDKKAGALLLHKLMEDLLMDYEENIDLLAMLLNLEGSKMSMPRVLTTLPSSFPLQKILTFLQDSIRQCDNGVHDARLKSELYKVGSFKMKYEVLKAQSTSFTLLARRCGVCGKRLGNGVLYAYIDGGVAHFLCVEH